MTTDMHDTRPPVQSAPAPQCEYKTESGRRCKLTAGHDKTGTPSGHRMALKTEAIPTLAELKAKGLQFTLQMDEAPKSADLGRSHKRTLAPRDADQKHVDADALKAYQAWEKSGRPKDFVKSPVQRYIFPPEATSSVFAMLRCATMSGGPVAGKVLKYRLKTHESGNAMIYFTVTDRAPVKPAAVKPAAVTPTAAEPGATSA